jgi:hypothetical protein
LLPAVRLTQMPLRFNHTRLLEPIGYILPAEFEEAYYAQAAATEAGEALKQTSLH